MRPVLSVTLACLVASLSLVAPEGLAQQTPAAPKVGEAIKKAVKDPIDLNTATEEQLEGLPGIRKPLAKKIVGGRPFKAPDELVSKKILSREAFDKIKSLVHVKP